MGFNRTIRSRAQYFYFFSSGEPVPVPVRVTFSFYFLSTSFYVTKIPQMRMLLSETLLPIVISGFTALFFTHCSLKQSSIVFYFCFIICYTFIATGFIIIIK